MFGRSGVAAEPEDVRLEVACNLVPLGVPRIIPPVPFPTLNMKTADDSLRCQTLNDQQHRFEQDPSLITKSPNMSTHGCNCHTVDSVDAFDGLAVKQPAGLTLNFSHAHANVRVPLAPLPPYVATNRMSDGER